MMKYGPALLEKMEREKPKYPVLVGEMRKHRETQQTLGKLLGINRMTVGKKLVGKYDWTISEIEVICNHYQKDYYQLFKGEE